jgi:hypothetical protein
MDTDQIEIDGKRLYDEIMAELASLRQAGFSEYELKLTAIDLVHICTDVPQKVRDAAERIARES